MKNEEVCVKINTPVCEIKKMIIYFMCNISVQSVCSCVFFCVYKFYLLSLEEGLPKITEHDLERSSSVQSIH